MVSRLVISDISYVLALGYAEADDGGDPFVGRWAAVLDPDLEDGADAFLLLLEPVGSRVCPHPGFQDHQACVGVCRRERGEPGKNQVLELNLPAVRERCEELA